MADIFQAVHIDPKRVMPDGVHKKFFIDLSTELGLLGLAFSKIDEVIELTVVRYTGGSATVLTVVTVTLNALIPKFTIELSSVPGASTDIVNDYILVDAWLGFKVTA